MRVCAKVAVCLAASATVAFGQSVIYVDADAGGQQNGRNWTDAYVDLQDALRKADPGDEIWVAEGSYFPGEAGDWESTFQMKSGVGLYGGFTGVEDRRDQRDPYTHETILSGDIDHNDVYGQYTWDGPGWNGNADNVFHVVTTDGVDETAVIDGFTILGGSTNYGNHVAPYGDTGSGVFNDGGSPTFVDCTIKRNTASYGAGVYSLGGSPTFIRCTIKENRVHLLEGAGIAIVEGATLTLTDCLLTQNRLKGGTNQGAGAALSVRQGCTAEIDRCSFIDNSADNFYPSGDYIGTYGGAIHHMGDDLTVRNSVFRQNRSNAGGAIWAWKDATIVNCLFIDNRAPEYQARQGGWGGIGGAIGTSAYTPNRVKIINSTLVNNTAEAGAGLRVLNNAEALVHNSIFWGNRDRNGVIGPSQIKGAGATYSCIQNMLQGEPGEDPPEKKKFPHCFDDDPRFVNYGGLDLRLAAGSPCIDAADNDELPNGIGVDLDGKPRYVDDPATPDTGNGTAPIVDMGAYEFQAGGGESCTGSETLKVTCKSGRKNVAKAKLSRGLPDATVTFRLDGDPNTDTARVVKSSGKATAKFKNVAPGPHTIEVVECGASAGC